MEDEEGVEAGDEVEAVEDEEGVEAGDDEVILHLHLHLEHLEAFSHSQ